MPRPLARLLFRAGIEERLPVRGGFSPAFLVGLGFVDGRRAS